MGTNEGLKEERFEKIVKAWIGCLGWLLISMMGGLILTCWELKYHQTNTQQWMVPLGLILFITPILAYLAVYISSIFSAPSIEATDLLNLNRPPILPFINTEDNQNRVYWGNRHISSL